MSVRLSDLKLISVYQLPSRMTQKRGKKKKKNSSWCCSETEMGANGRENIFYFGLKHKL